LELNGSFPDSLKASFLKNNWQLQNSALKGCSGNKGERTQKQVKKRVTRKSSKATFLVYAFKKEVGCFAFTTLHTYRK